VSPARNRVVCPPHQNSSSPSTTWNVSSSRWWTWGGTRSPGCPTISTSANAPWVCLPSSNTRVGVPRTSRVETLSAWEVTGWRDIAKGESEVRRRFYLAFKNRRRLANPCTAISSRVGSIRRQIAAARAMTFTSVVKLSITTSPSYRIFFRAATIGFQSM
jgi:hypothetical protein